jgi:hypothetical protein
MSTFEIQQNGLASELEGATKSSTAVIVTTMALQCMSIIALACYLCFSSSIALAVSLVGLLFSQMFQQWENETKLKRLKDIVENRLTQK